MNYDDDKEIDGELPDEKVSPEEVSEDEDEDEEGLVSSIGGDDDEMGSGKWE